MTERNNRMAPSFRSRVGVGANGRRGQVLVKAAEALPVLVKVTAQLADPGGAEAELRAHVQGAFPSHQVLGQAAVSLRTRPEPRREVEAEAGLLRRRRLRVIHQRLRKRVAAERAEVGQALDFDVVLPLGRGGQYVPGPLPTANPSARFD